MGKKIAIALVVFASLICSAALGHSHAGAWISVIPPLMAVCFIYATQKLFVGLIAAVLSGGLLSAWQSQQSVMIDGPRKFFGFFETTLSDSWNLQIILFVFLMMAAVEVMVASGGFQAIINAISQFARGKRASQLLTGLLGVGIFFDDYVNSMVVGSGMRPLTDKTGVSRAKLAFIVDATSAPVAGLAIVSTWIGYEVGLFAKVAESLNWGIDGYGVFFDALSFRFYCVLMIAFVFLNILMGRDYGAMLAAEQAAEPSHQAADTGTKARQFGQASAIAIPVGILLTAIFVGLWMDGNGQGSIFSMANWRVALTGAENTVQIFALAASFSLIAALFCAHVIAGLRLSAVSRSVWQGFRKALVPAAILVMAWTLKGACDALGTGDYLASLLTATLPAMAFPAALFLVSGIVAFSTGTSWGTMAILIPVAAPAAFALDGHAYGLVTMMSMGAVLDGAIFGDHCSPISDTTILSSSASQCNHIEHVRTQMPYALTVAAVALVFGYIPAAAGVSSNILILLAVGVLAAVLKIWGRPVAPSAWTAEVSVPADTTLAVCTANRANQ